jgi:hypothetical protein
MRKRFRVPLLAAVVAAFVVPVSFALSIDSGHGASRAVSLPPAAVASAATAVTSSVVIAAPASRHLARSTAMPGTLQMPDAAKLLLVGTVLFGLAAFVRRAS